MSVLLLGTINPVSAGPPSQSGNVERFEILGGLVYDNGEYAVVTGPAFEQGCFGEGFPPINTQVVNRGNGTFSETWQIKDIRVMVFEWEGNVFDLIDLNCASIASGGAAVVEPIAVGQGRHSFTSRGDDNGVHVQNTLTAKVTTTDGQRAHVNAFASVDLSPAGEDNLVLRINYTG